MTDTPIADTLSGLAGISSRTDRDARYAKAVIAVADLERDLGRKTQALRRAQELIEEGSAADEIIADALKQQSSKGGEK